MSDQTIKYTDDSHKLNANTYELEGHVFIGWNTSVDGSGISYGDEADISKYVNSRGGSLTLYAQWAPVFTLTGVAVGDHGTITFDPTSPVKAGTLVNIRVEHNSGYITETVSATKNSDGSQIQINNGRFSMPDDDVTVTATFQRLIDDSTATVVITPSSAYEGHQNVAPSVEVTVDQTTLTCGTDYDLAWSKDGEPVSSFTQTGTYVVTITGIGGYTGSVTEEFVVEPEPQP